MPKHCVCKARSTLQIFENPMDNFQAQKISLDIIHQETFLCNIHTDYCSARARNGCHTQTRFITLQIHFGDKFTAYHKVLFSLFKSALTYGDMV